jgi:hypothetical protein
LLVAVGLRELRQTEVQNLYSAVVSDEDVVRFQIAMNYSLLVCGSEPMSDLQSVIDGPPWTEWSF